MNVRLKSKVLAAALAMAFAGSAQAALDYQELGFYASNGSANSVFFDLGVNMSQFTPAATSAPGTTITWDLTNGTVSSSTPGSTVFNYGSVWSGFSFSSSTIWGVIAPDEVIGDIYTTTNAGVSALNNTTSDNAFQAALSVDGVYYNALGSTGTHATDPNGASFNSSGNALHFNGFGGNDQWRQQTPFAAGRLGDGSLPFYKFAYDLDPGPALRTNFAGIWTMNSAAGTLTYSVAPLAPIPEPSAYALVAIGLAGLGSLVRRRKNG